ncbi:MAG: outer membrane protein transport protein [bacterium]
MRTSRMNRLADALGALALLAIVTAGAGPASASAPDLFGFGMRSPGMGATGVAHSMGYESVYTNPAGLTNADNKRLTVGYLFGTFELGLSENLRRIRAPRADNTYGLIIGANIPLAFKGWLKNKMWVGMGFYLPTGVVTRARVPLPGQPFFATLESRTQVVGVMVAGAVEPLPGFRIGAGVLALAALTGTVWISADAAGSIGSTVEQQLIVDYAPIFGVMWTPKWVPKLSFGLTYRGESIAGFDVVLENTLQDELPVGIPEMTISGVAQFDPQQVALEVAYRPISSLLLAVQVCWKDWSRYPLPTRNVTVAARDQPLPKFRDTVVGRLGLEQEWKVHRWRLALRGGYFFEPTPIPEQTGLLNLLDNHRHVFSLGFGAAFRKGVVVPFSVDLFFQYHYLMPQKHTKDQSVVADPLADPMLTRFSRSSFRTWGYLIATGIQMGVEF